MTFAALRVPEDAGGELLRLSLAVVQHLVEGGFDLLLRKPGFLCQPQRADVGIVKGTAQNGDGDGPAEQGQGQGGGDEAGERFAGFHGRSSFSGRADRAMSTWEGR